MSKIHILSDELINQIAAGEIIERPTSIIKELVENSIDANSNKINVFIQDAGKSKIVIEDNGYGMDQSDLQLAIKRHATSKLDTNNLMGITTYGFRGEALPSIASVSQLRIESNGFEISVNFSIENNIIRSNFKTGTKITVSNLFDKLPARLKFLKSDNVETTHCISVIENFALTHPRITFSIRDDKKLLCNFDTNSLEDRISAIIGNELFSRAIQINEENDIMKVEGYLFHPMDSKYSQSSQKIFINNRIVKDRIVSSSIKNAYKDIIPAGRFALCVLFITINPFYLDVNVSPTKSEIRFRDTNYVQKFLSDSINKNLNKFDRISLIVDNSKLGVKNENFDYTTIKPVNNKLQLHDITYDKNHELNKRYIDQDLNKFYNNNSENNKQNNNKLDVLNNKKEFGKADIDVIKNKFDNNFQINNDENNNIKDIIKNFDNDLENFNNFKGNNNIKNIVQKFDNKLEAFNNKQKNVSDEKIENFIENIADNLENVELNDDFFGEPMGQFLDTYIICKTQNELVIIDQHAVHEKIKMEDIKMNLNKNSKQYLTNPIKLLLNNKQLLIANSILDKLNELGFIIKIDEEFLIINAIPSILNDINVEPFFYDILENEYNINEINIDDCIRLRVATSACHNSIRAGRKLSINEMNETINEMKRTFSVHQCNHNRPSFIKITLQQLNNIFKRT